MKQSAPKDNWYKVTGILDSAESFLWCSRHPSAGNFYYSCSVLLTETEWLFELEKDALLFILTWGSK